MQPCSPSSPRHADPHLHPGRICARTATYAAVLAASTCGALAADYPLRPLRLVVPYVAGGGTDPVAKAVPDGYTLLLGNVGPIAINLSIPSSCVRT